MALAVCLLLDDRADAAVRGLWRRLESAGVPTLMSHTHGRHVPHLTLASVRGVLPGAVLNALTHLAPAPPVELQFDALGTFRRTRCWLAPTVTGELVARHAEVTEALTSTGGQLHQHYRPGHWVPHLTIAPRLHLTDLGTVAAHVYDLLPLPAVLDRAAVIDTSTGAHHPLPRSPGELPA